MLVGMFGAPVAGKICVAAGTSLRSGRIIQRLQLQPLPPLRFRIVKQI